MKPARFKSARAKRRAAAARERREKERVVKNILSAGAFVTSFVDICDVIGIILDVLLDNPWARDSRLANVITAGIDRISDPELETTLCSCCDHEFDRDEFPRLIAVISPDGDDEFRFAMTAVVCKTCAALPFSEIKRRFVASLSSDAGIDIRELRAEHGRNFAAHPNDSDAGSDCPIIVC